MDHKFSDSYNRVILKPLTIDDSFKLCKLRNANRNWFFFSGEITIEIQKEWYQKYLDDLNDIMFSVFLHNSQTWIGSVALYSIDRQKGEAEFGRLMIDGSIDGTKGCGLDATICICRIGFEQIGLSNINLEVYSDNIPAFKTYERAGFYLNAIRESNGREIIIMRLNKETFIL